MPEMQGQLVPESEVEWQLMQDLYADTAEAKQGGMSTADITTVLNFVASSIQAHDADPEAESVPDFDKHLSRAEKCPQCEHPIEAVVPSIGGEAQVQPCGCRVDRGEIPVWTKVENDE